jgi:hypothetical protein
MTFKCEKCGSKRKPKLGKKRIAHPKGGHTVLGRLLELVVEIGFVECPVCKWKKCVNLSLPLDPDAALVREVFDLEGHTKEEQEGIFAYLREHGISPDDLEELRQMKGRALSNKELNTMSEWFTKRGMPVPEIVVEGEQT